MKFPRPKSFAVGPYTVRQDAGQSRRARVFLDSQEVFSSEDLGAALTFAQQRAFTSTRTAVGLALYYRQEES